MSKRVENMNKLLNNIIKKHNLNIYEKEKEINKYKEKQIILNKKIISLEKRKIDLNRSNSNDNKSNIISFNNEISNSSKRKYRNFPIKIIKRNNNSDFNNSKLFFNKSQLIGEKSLLNPISLSINNYNKPKYSSRIFKKKNELNIHFDKYQNNIAFNMNNIIKDKIKIQQKLEEYLKILDKKINNFKNENCKEKKIKMNQRAKSCLRSNIPLSNSNSLRYPGKKHHDKSNIFNSINLSHMNITLKNFEKSYNFNLKIKKIN